MTARAFLALWNGVQPDRRDEYEAWHGIEHMPERLGAPGFLAARRYRAEAGEDYFTVYELESLEALDSDAYAALMHEPTAWSLRMRQAMTGFRRLPCLPAFHRRHGLGGAMVTLRLERAAGQLLPLLRPLLDEALQHGVVLGAVLGSSDAAGKPYPIFPNAPVPGVESLLLLEGTEQDRIMALARDCAGLLGQESALQPWRLLQCLQREELPDPSLPRQAAKNDLMHHWLHRDSHQSGI